MDDTITTTTAVPTMQWIQCDGPNCGRWFSDNDYATNNLVINSNEGQQQQISASPSELSNKFDKWYCPSCVPYYGIGTYKSSKRPGLRKRSRPIDFYTRLHDPGGNVGKSTTIVNSSVSDNNDDNCNYGSLLSAIIMSSNQDTTAINVDFEKLLQTKRRTHTSGGGSYFVTDTIEVIRSSSLSGVDDTEEIDISAIFAKHGYDHPLLFDTSITPKMLGMILPPQPFGYDNVCQLVGPYRPIQVTDVATQRTVDCTLKEFVNYLLHYDEITTSTTRKDIKQGSSGSKQQKCRTRIINSITLEVSKTPLGELVKEPKFARDVDLVELNWPRSVEEIINGRSTNSYQQCCSSSEEEKSSLSSIPTNTSSLPPLSSSSLTALTKKEEMNHKWNEEGSVSNNLHNNELEYTTIIYEKPHVTKYCLMSAAGSYTDFHVDFGGTSVWYHVYAGTKIFHFIEPTITNINIYTNWATNKKHLIAKKKVGTSVAATTSVTEKYVFLPDLIHAAGGVVHEVTVTQGQTLFIPSGWFHAVFTPIDSLVFGGNFLHQQSLDMQLQIHRLENVMKVGPEFRFPYFQKLLWYTARDFIMECTELIKRTKLSGEEKEEEVVMKMVNASNKEVVVKPRGSKSKPPREQIAKKDTEKSQLDHHQARILCVTYPSHVLRGYGALAKELSRWSNSRIKSTIEQYPVHMDVVAVASELGRIIRLCMTQKK